MWLRNIITNGNYFSDLILFIKPVIYLDLYVMKLKIIFKYSLMILMTVIIILLFSIVIRAFVLNSFALMARAFSNVTSEDYKMILVVFISLFIILTPFSFVFLIKMKRKILKIIYVTAIYFAAMVCSRVDSSLKNLKISMS